MREIKFRFWNKLNNRMYTWEWFVGMDTPGRYYKMQGFQYVPMQYTGLNDKKSLTDIYEYDILDEVGSIIGNTFENKELLNEKGNVKNLSHLIIQEFGAKTWGETYNETILRGCTDSK